MPPGHIQAMLLTFLPQSEELPRPTSPPCGMMGEMQGHTALSPH